MDLSGLPNYDAALTLVRQAQSARAKHLHVLESYVKGCQYAGKPDWFSSEKPLWERAPCIVYPIAKAAIDSNVDLVLGEKTFPAISVPHIDPALDDDAPDTDEAKAAAKEDAEIVNRWLCEFEHYTRLRPVATELFASAQGCGSAVAIVGIRSGRVVVDTTRASWCTPTLDADGAVLILEIEYPYLTQTKDASGAWIVEAMMYRRVIDAQQDVTFKPAKIAAGPPSWTPLTTITHGLGFCPVVWYAFQKGCSTVVDFDGHAIHACLLDEITGLDFTLSQKHRAALYAGDPQWTETGVEPGYNPSPGGRPAHSMPATMTGGPVSAANPQTGNYSTAPRGNVRKKSPGDVWTYENPNTTVTLHTLPGDALTSLDNHAKDLKLKICEAMGVVFIDPMDMPRGGELSARAIAALKARQLDRCDAYRSDFGDLCLRPLVNMLFRLITTRPEGLKLPGLKKVLPLLEQLLERGLLLRLSWGPYSQPEPAEDLAIVQAAALALTTGFATMKSAVMMTKDVQGIEDVDEHMEQLEVEKAEKVAAVAEQMKQQADLAAASKPAPGAQGAAPKPNSAVAQTESK